METERVMPTCTVCGQELGYENPRQLCRKTYCENQPLDTEESLSGSEDRGSESALDKENHGGERVEESARPMSPQTVPKRMVVVRVELPHDSHFMSVNARDFREGRSDLMGIRLRIPFGGGQDLVIRVDAPNSGMPKYIGGEGGLFGGEGGLSAVSCFVPSARL